MGETRMTYAIINVVFFFWIVDVIVDVSVSVAAAVIIPRYSWMFSKLNT